jgi:hypothetical protein
VRTCLSTKPVDCMTAILLSARELITSRSQREDQHNPRDSMNNHNFKQLAEIGVEGERFRTGGVMSYLGIGKCLFVRFKMLPATFVLTKV